MRLNELGDNAGATKNRKRVGRGLVVVAVDAG